MFKLFTNKLDEKRLLWLIIGAVLLSGTGSFAINALSAADLGSELLGWVEAWLLDLSTDLASGGVVYALLRRFLRQAAPEPSYIDAVQTALPAITDAPPLMDELKKADTPETRQWILNRAKSSLRGAHLVDANLERANLANADLQGADLTKARLRSAILSQANLRRANLSQAQLIEANLRGADLREAVMRRAFLSGADLRGAKLAGAVLQTSLWGTNLGNADLNGADLRGAELFRTDLSGANLQGVQLQDATINPDTILPDGKQWQPKTDLRRFTDPTHPQFWRSDDPASPAFGG